MATAANRCAARTCEGCGRCGVHSHALGFMCMSAAHASSGHMTVDLGITLHTLTPLAGFLTFSWVLEAARGGRAHQQRVRCRALDARDPSTIIPNHHPHTAHVARTPSASTGSRCSYLIRAGCGGRGWQWMYYQHGPRTSSFFVGPGVKPRAVLAGRPGTFWAVSEDFFESRFAIFCSWARGRGVGGLDAHVHRVMVCFYKCVLECQTSFLDL